MKLINFGLVSVLVILTFYLLIVGQDVLLPVVIALVFWYLINLVAKSYSRLKISGKSLPGWFCFSLSLSLSRPYSLSELLFLSYSPTPIFFLSLGPIFSRVFFDLNHQKKKKTL